MNYPGFQALPKGLKQMLLVSEAHFFDPPAPHYTEQVAALAMKTKHGFKVLFRRCAETTKITDRPGLVLHAIPRWCDRVA
jgi:hypothetical protein